MRLQQLALSRSWGHDGVMAHNPKIVNQLRALVLLTQTEETQVRRLAEKLIGAHKATVEWLTVVLAEEALGGPAALAATPVQKVAGGVARAVNAPVRLWANTVNNAVDTVKH